MSGARRPLPRFRCSGQSGAWQHLPMPVVRDALPTDAGSIGEAHAEAWRVAYEELFPADQLAAAVDVRRRIWVGLIGDSALGGRGPERSSVSSITAQRQRPKAKLKSTASTCIRLHGELATRKR
jgi:hypothetical protein